MKLESIAHYVALFAVVIPWATYGAMLAIHEFKKMRLTDTATKQADQQDDDDEDGDTGGPDKPVTPYDIDPQFDPSDWWKHDGPKQASRN
jgi:hypothetical protein